MITSVVFGHQIDEKRVVYKIIIGEIKLQLFDNTCLRLIANQIHG